MSQTRRQAVHLLQRPYTCRLRRYPEINFIGRNSSNGTPFAHDVSPGHHESTHHNSYPIPEDEPIGKGLYISLAVFFGSIAIYKFSYSDVSDPASAGQVSKQPFITRFLHNFDYMGEQYAIRNALFTSLMEQAGHDKNLFMGTPPSQYYELKAPEVVFNGGCPWNVPAGHNADLRHVRKHYLRQRERLDQERIERMDRMRRYDSGEVVC